MTRKLTELDRRQFLRGAATVGVAAGTATAAALGSNAADAAELVAGDATTALDPNTGEFPEVSTSSFSLSRSTLRRNRAANLRIRLAKQNLLKTPANLQYPTNGDETRYPDKRASFAKGLPHNADGTPDLAAYATLVKAVEEGERNPALFDAIAISDPTLFPFGGRRLLNPQASLAFEVEGRDAQSYVQAPPPAFASRQETAEIAENYWSALLRDVPFSEYPSNAVAIAAARDLTAFGVDFKGPKDAAGVVTPQLLFRGNPPGVRRGPWLSQFFYLPCNLGSNEVNQQIRTLLPLGRGGKEYLTTFASWLQDQRGANPLSPSMVDVRSGGSEVGTLDPVLRYMRTGRDISQWVHNDVLFQGYLQAFLVLASLGAPPDAGNPYIGNLTQVGFATFGGPAIATILCEVTTRAMHATWFQKWQIHRRLRPEAFGGRIEYNRTHPGRFDVHPALNSSSVLPAILAHNERINGSGKGTYLLPQAFPEAAPLNAAYAGGHAAIAGACVTVLKAYFNEEAKISSLTQPVQPTTDGLALVPYTGADAGQLTVGGELDKLAYNVGNGRNIAGVHWLTDASISLALGEQVAISVLREQRATYNERFGGLSLTLFDGTRITV
jgi:membrane-associated phospholipid phosphatase